MKQPTFFYSCLLVAGLFLSSCGNSDRALMYNNYTKVDTEAFNFLHIVYEEALFQEYAALNLNPKSEELATKYKDLANGIASLAIESDVILPEFAADHFDVKAGISTGTSQSVISPAVDTLAVDSVAAATNNTAAQPVPTLSADQIAGKVKKSQDEIIHQLENVARNTNTAVQDFANEKLNEFGH